jgi:hypothetical protein
MIITLSEFKGSPFIAMGFEKALLYYVRTVGPITSLDRFAHNQGVDPRTVRRCAHSAADKGLVKMTRLKNLSGRPYRVSALEERHNEK